MIYNNLGSSHKQWMHNFTIDKPALESSLQVFLVPSHQNKCVSVNGPHTYLPSFSKQEPIYLSHPLSFVEKKYVYNIFYYLDYKAAYKYIMLRKPSWGRSVRIFIQSFSDYFVNIIIISSRWWWWCLAFYGHFVHLVG